MINLQKAKNEFINYTNQFDQENKNIKGKVDHSLRVMEISNELAEELKLEQEEIELATLIGLLHDIGRFEQRTKFNTFSDIKSIDHGKLGVEILEKNNYLDKFIETRQYDGIIKKSIRNHNQYKIEDGVNAKELQFCKLIKDADKIDIFYEATEFFWQDEQIHKEIEGSVITKEVWEQFQNQVLVENGTKKNELDHFIGLLSFVFDLNFKQSMQIILKNEYINKCINRFDFEQPKTKEQINIIKEQIDKYLKEKIQK